MYDIHIRWTAFPLHPETPEEGLTLEALFAGRNVDVVRMKSHLQNAAKRFGMSIGDRERTYNSRLAQELGKWAETESKGNPFHLAVFKAYFIDGRNIARIPTLVDIATSVHLIRTEAKRVLEERTFEKAVDLDWKRCSEMGIRAVPTFVINGQSLIGAQSYETLEQLMLTHNVQPRKSEKMT